VSTLLSSKALKTIEFKLDLNESQQAKLENWLAHMRWVWNRGLNLLEEFDDFSSWDKHSKTWVPSCPIPWQYYKNDDGQLVPFTRLAQKKPYRASCPIPRAYRKPELESPSYFGLLYHFAQKNHPDKPWFCEIPSKFVAGTVKSLTDAWGEYKAGKRKRPRYKRYNDKVKTLINNNSKSIKVEGNQITLPKLGKTTVKTLAKRWDASVPIATLKITKEPSGYYLQLTGELPVKKLKSCNKAAGISLSYRGLLTADNGKQVASPTYYRKLEKRLQKLQRKQSRQQNLSMISTYNPNLKEHFLSCPINPGKGANKAKTQHKISLLHEKIRRARKAFNHKISSKLVQEYDAIAAIKPEVKKIVRRPKPIVNKEGTGYEKNGAFIKTLFNKSILDIGLGQFTALLEQKAVANGREYFEIAPKDIPEVLRARAEHFSKTLQMPRAALLSAFPLERYRAWAWSTPGESPPTLNQEATQVAPLPDGETTTKTSSQSDSATKAVELQAASYNKTRARRKKPTSPELQPTDLASIKPAHASQSQETSQSAQSKSRSKTGRENSGGADAIDSS